MVIGLVQDIRYAVRSLRHSPAFTIAAVLTLSLGIGANAAIFTVLQGVALAPLHYFRPDRLTVIWENNPRYPRVSVSYPNFQDWRRSAHSFSQMAIFMDQEIDLNWPGTPAHVKSREISSGLFSLLGVNPVAGREFLSSEDIYGGSRVAMVSETLSKERFGNSMQAIGKVVTLNGADYTIVGVVPAAFYFEFAQRLRDAADVYRPIGQFDPLILNIRGGHVGPVALARLQAGVTMAQAQGEMSTVQYRLDQLYPDDNRDTGIYLEPLKQVVVGEAGTILLLLLGAVGFVLLIACSNVANLLLARSVARTRELALRLALGANRIILVRQLLIESLLLSFVGAALGLIIAMGAIQPALAALPETLPRTQNVEINSAVLLFTTVVSVLVGIVFGLVPALKLRKLDVQAGLKEGSHTATSRQNLQGLFVTGQIALTLVLLTGAGLLLRTIRYMGQLDPGFDEQHLITLRVGVSPTLTRTAENTRVAYQQLIDRIRAVPGVDAAELTSAIPLTGQGGTTPFWIDDEKPASLQAAPRIVMFMTGPRYLETMGIPLLQGRFVTAEDTAKSPCVAVIDSVLARSYFPHTDPVGKRLTVGFVPHGPCEIVGVVGHVRHFGLDDPSSISQNQAYFPIAQNPDEWVTSAYAFAKVMVRSTTNLTILLPELKKSVYAAGDDQPIYDVRTMSDVAAESLSSRRFPMLLLEVFAGLALILASVGIYGVISYSLGQRGHEIGIRIALGAKRGHVLGMIFRQSSNLIGIGLVIGAGAAMTLTQVLSKLPRLLYGIAAYDPLTFISASLILSAVALVACYIPARRAMKVDPMVALRHD